MNIIMFPGLTFGNGSYLLIGNAPVRKLLPTAMMCEPWGRRCEEGEEQYRGREVCVMALCSYLVLSCWNTGAYYGLSVRY